jgi:aspartate racemase
MRHIGIVAHSVPGAAQCFQAIAHYGEQDLGEHEHPDVTLDCIAMGRGMRAWQTGDHDTIRAILATSVERLARAGADFFVCPDNTAHLALERPGPALALPGLHIAEVVAQQASTAGYRTVGVLGTRWTMEAELYPRALAAHGLHSQSPCREDREMIQHITFDQLVKGVFTAEAEQHFVEFIARLAEAGCDAVALVCTEFPLLISPERSPLPTLDSTDLLARAAVSTALDNDLPTWRGGPAVLGEHAGGAGLTGARPVRDGAEGR